MAKEGKGYFQWGWKLILFIKPKSYELFFKILRRFVKFYKYLHIFSVSFTTGNPYPDNFKLIYTFDDINFPDITASDFYYKFSSNI